LNPFSYGFPIKLTTLCMDRIGFTIAMLAEVV